MPRVRRKKINSGRAMVLFHCPTAIARFLKFVLVVPGRLRTPCWVWQGHKDDSGYGQFRMNGRVEWAHRAGYTLFRGPIPADTQIDHRCKNTSCVCPWHVRRRQPLLNARDGARDRHLVGATCGEI